MDRFPQEVIDRIVSHINTRLVQERAGGRSPPRLRPALATFSPKFQRAVETFTFQELQIKSTEAEALEQMFERCPERGRYLRRVRLVLILPMYSAAKFGEFELDADRAANDRAVSKELDKVFRLLDKWCGSEARLDLSIEDAYSPSDAGHRSLIDQHTSPWRATLHGGDEEEMSSKPDLEERRYRYSLLNLDVDGHSHLPSLPCVRKFTIRNGNRPWHPNAVLGLTSKMTQAHAIDWSIYDNYNELWGRYYAMDTLWRDALVTAVESSEQRKIPLLPLSTTEFRAAIMSPKAKEYEQLPNLMRQGNGNDPVGLALQRLSRGCHKVSFLAPVHRSLFDSLTGPNPSDPQVWANLRQLRVNVDIRGPHGKWYFELPDGQGPSDEPYAQEAVQLPPGYGATQEELQDAAEFHEENFAQEDEEEYDDDDDFVPFRLRRTFPADAEMNPLLRSFARACARLPCLRIAVLMAEYNNEDGCPFQVICAAPGTSMGHWDSMYARGRRNMWRVYLHAEDWLPDVEALKEFKLIGIKSKRGGPPEERQTVLAYLPWGDCLPNSYS